MGNNTSLGTKLESEVREWLKAHSWPWAHRRERRGASDIGDVCLSERVPFTIECKSAKGTTERATLSTWVKELQEEVNNVGDDGGAVVHKKRGTTDVGEYYAILPVKYLNDLLIRAYGEEPPRRRLVRRKR